MPPPSSPEALLSKLERFPRSSLAFLPTPLERLPSMSRDLAPLSLAIKRDDQTGLAFGGNKARKLEFIMADVMEKEADTVVTWAGVQSNWCRQVAAATSRLGLRSVLLLMKKPGGPVGFDGNLLLDRILDADIRVVEPQGGKSFLELENVREHLDPVVEEERAAGRSPYIAPVGGSLVEGSMERPLGALGYVAAFLEIFLQAREEEIELDTVVLATGSAGTQAGLLVGAKLLSPHTRIVGISVAADSETVSAYVKDIAERTLEILDAPPVVLDEEIVVLDQYLDQGYGVLSRTVTDAVRTMAQSEGVLLDPVYTGKAMAGLLDLAQKGFFRREESVVFLHTGGTPALFPYREGILELMGE
jgi:D-cysteine desulfhydrase family pyridoxal phosphate-dependent enzyme